MGVITHKRAWAIRAGVVAVLAASGLFGIAAPALAAAGAQLSDISVDPTTINQGQQVTVKFSVKNTGDASNTITVETTSSSGKVTCVGSCKQSLVSFNKDEVKQYTFKFTASGSFPGAEQANLNIKASPTGGSPVQDSEQINVNAQPQQNQGSVPEVSGTVVNIFDNTPIDAATVAIQDSASPPHTYQTGTDKSGNFKFTSSGDKPIVPGTIAFQVDKTGIQQFTTTKQAFANQPLVTVRLTVTPSASPGASATAAVPTLSAGPTSALPEDSGNGTNVNTGSGGGGLSWVLIAIGAVLVLLGIGAIVLLFVRRNNDAGDDEDDGRGGPPRKGGPRGGQPGGRGGPPGPGRPGPAPRPGPGGGRGGPGYDPTRQMRPPVAPGPRADQTMIAPSPLAGAPTQVHGRPGVDPGRPNGYGPGPRRPRSVRRPGGRWRLWPAAAELRRPDQRLPRRLRAAGRSVRAAGVRHPPPPPDPYAPPPPSYGPPDPRTPRPGHPPDGRRVDWLED